MKNILIFFIVLSFFTSESQAQTVTDYDGNVYEIITIGAGAWLKENLKVTHYNNGVPIPNVKNNAEWAVLTTGARCYYNNDSIANDSVYGALYNWYAINDTNDLCPSGWHVSTNADWIAAENYLGGASVAGGKMKEAGTLHWLSPNTGATNSSGFTGLPGGFRGFSNTFQFMGENGLWWTATANGSNAWSTYLWYMFAGVDHNPVPKTPGMSVRCVKNLVTGMEHSVSPGNIRLYPNPASDHATIESIDYQNAHALVYSVAGELVLQSSLTGITNQLDIRSLSNGVYILKINGEHGTIWQKIIKN